MLVGTLPVTPVTQAEPVAFDNKGAKMLIVMESPGNRTLHSKAASSLSSGHNDCRTSERTRLVEILSELRSLLEDYSPSWYTEEQHRKVESALHREKKH